MTLFDFANVVRQTTLFDEPVHIGGGVMAEHPTPGVWTLRDATGRIALYQSSYAHKAIVLFQTGAVASAVMTDNAINPAGCLLEQSYLYPEYPPVAVYVSVMPGQPYTLHRPLAVPDEKATQETTGGYWSYVTFDLLGEYREQDA